MVYRRHKKKKNRNPKSLNDSKQLLIVAIVTRWPNVKSVVRREKEKRAHFDFIRIIPYISAYNAH